MSPTPPKRPSVIRKFFAWSFSRFTAYRSCPAAAAYKNIDKLEPFEKNDDKVAAIVADRKSGKLKAIPGDVEATVKGSVVHALAEDFTKGKLKKLPSELETFSEEFKDLRKKPTVQEKEWAFTSAWEPTSWFAKDAWLRVKVDNHYIEGTTCKILDYKTGKAPIAPPSYYEERGELPPKANDPNYNKWDTGKYREHQEQREIYALSVFIMYPDVKTVFAEHWYTDAGVRYSDSYNRKDFEKLKREWEKKIKPMMNDTTFAPRPSSSACRFCSFAKSKGGPCKYN